MASASSSPSQQQLDAIALVQRLDSAIKGNPPPGLDIKSSAVKRGGTVILQGPRSLILSKANGPRSFAKSRGCRADCERSGS